MKVQPAVKSMNRQYLLWAVWLPRVLNMVCFLPIINSCSRLRCGFHSRVQAWWCRVLTFVWMALVRVF